MHAAVKRIATEVAALHAVEVTGSRFPTKPRGAARRAGVVRGCVPRAGRGLGCTLRQLAELCSSLCTTGSSAMVLAMHYIQVGCTARHDRAPVSAQLPAGTRCSGNTCSVHDFLRLEPSERRVRASARLNTRARLLGLAKDATRLVLRTPTAHFRELPAYA